MKLSGDSDGLWIVKVLTGAGLCESASHARRMIKQGAVSLDGGKVTDVEFRLERRTDAYTVKVGKRRFASVTIK